mmetsp:Transcript_27008/g.68681  ORF Transcript_27008/g.68681 Transcript_27008/m.68681 type:complete len:242 (+) Transcript_27008:344-1069(+)
MARGAWRLPRSAPEGRRRRGGREEWQGLHAASWRGGRTAALQDVDPRQEPVDGRDGGRAVHPLCQVRPARLRSCHARQHPRARRVYRGRRGTQGLPLARVLQAARRASLPRVGARRGASEGRGGRGRRGEWWYRPSCRRQGSGGVRRSPHGRRRGGWCGGRRGGREYRSDALRQESRLPEQQGRPASALWQALRSPCRHRRYQARRQRQDQAPLDGIWLCRVRQRDGGAGSAARNGWCTAP